MYMFFVERMFCDIVCIHNNMAHPFTIGAFGIIFDEHERALLVHRTDYDLWNSRSMCASFSVNHENSNRAVLD